MWPRVCLCNKKIFFDTHFQCLPSDDACVIRPLMLLFIYCSIKNLMIYLTMYNNECKFYHYSAYVTSHRIKYLYDKLYWSGQVSLRALAVTTSTTKRDVNLVNEELRRWYTSNGPRGHLRHQLKRSDLVHKCWLFIDIVVFSSFNAGAESFLD